MNTIDRFEGEYAWLSNFYPSSLVYFGRIFDTAEHAYQASKTLDELEFQSVKWAKTPGKAKRLGMKVTLRPDWEEIKLGVMKDICRIKCSKDPLKTWLLETKDAELVEGNNWGDTFWGRVNGLGANHLGYILMQVREELKQEGQYGASIKSERD